MNTKNEKQKVNLKAIVNPKIKGYGNDPAFVKRANESKQFLDKHGFPEVFQRRPGNT
jgi:hypothetical protein